MIMNKIIAWGTIWYHIFVPLGLIIFGMVLGIEFSDIMLMIIAIFSQQMASDLYMIRLIKEKELKK